MIKILLCELLTALFSIVGLGCMMYNFIMFMEVNNFSIKNLILAIISIIITLYVVYKLEKIEDKLRKRKGIR